LGQKKCKVCKGTGKILNRELKSKEKMKPEYFNDCGNCEGKGRMSSGKKKGGW
jgi:DnaJ-class molecular chaperone